MLTNAAVKPPLASGPRAEPEMIFGGQEAKSLRLRCYLYVVTLGPRERACRENWTMRERASVIEIFYPSNDRPCSHRGPCGMEAYFC